MRDKNFERLWAAWPQVCPRDDPRPDSASRSLYVSDFGRIAIWHVDADSGNRTIVSDSDRGSGPALHAPEDLVFGATKDEILFNSSTMTQGLALMRVSLGTGDRAIASGDLVGNGPQFSSLVGIGIDTDREVAYANSIHSAAIFAIDVTTGERVIISR